MITKEEAQKRIELWGGPYNHINLKRKDGKEFVKIELIYAPFDDDVPKIFKRHPVEMKIIDTFIYPK